jgi:hypothetical protein
MRRLSNLLSLTVAGVSNFARMDRLALTRRVLQPLTVSHGDAPVRVADQRDRGRTSSDARETAAVPDVNDAICRRKKNYGSQLPDSTGSNELVCDLSDVGLRIQGHCSLSISRALLQT